MWLYDAYAISAIKSAGLPKLRVVLDRHGTAFEATCAVVVRLRAAGLRLKAKKCDLRKCELIYLGHVVAADSVRMDPAKVQAKAAIAELTRP